MTRLTPPPWLRANPLLLGWVRLETLKYHSMLLFCVAPRQVHSPKSFLASRFTSCLHGPQNICGNWPLYPVLSKTFMEFLLNKLLLIDLIISFFL